MFVERFFRHRLFERGHCIDDLFARIRSIGRRREKDQNAVLSRFQRNRLAGELDKKPGARRYLILFLLLTRRVNVDELFFFARIIALTFGHGIYQY